MLHVVAVFVTLSSVTGLDDKIGESDINCTAVYRAEREAYYDAKQISLKLTMAYETMIYAQKQRGCEKVPRPDSCKNPQEFAETKNFESLNQKAFMANNAWARKHKQLQQQNYCLPKPQRKGRASSYKTNNHSRS